MKIQTPAANIVIGSIYLITLGIVIYITKLSLKNQQQEEKKVFKYNKKNMQKALIQQKYQLSISLNKIMLRSLGLKYSIIGSFVNRDKIYLLKEMLILSVICISATIINSIILWPIAIVFPLTLILFFYLQVGLKHQFKISKVHQADPQTQHYIQPNLNPNNENNVKQQSKNSLKKPLKITITITVLSFVTLILISQTMMMLYNSISNLGVLNLGSVAALFAIDQIALRPVLLLTFLGVINAYHALSKKSIFENSLIHNICENQLLTRVHGLEQEFGTDENISMGVSPTKKKSISPTKIPKAQLYFESQTQMNFETTSRKQTKLHPMDKIQQQQNKISPIKQLCISRNPSIYLTSAQKDLFNIQNVFDHNAEEEELPQLADGDKKMLNPDHFFSAQRLPKDRQNTQNIDEDGLILVQTGLNAFDGRRQHKLGQKSNTMDVDFSPSKRQKRRFKQRKNKRQLIITGNSPYLEYLPDMMKKVDKPNRKQTTPSHPQIPTISRKVL